MRIQVGIPCAAVILAAQAAYKIEDFKQPSLVFARIFSLFYVFKQGIMAC